MGFMDKAKKMAEQAQQKLEDAQQQFNQQQGSGGAAPSGAVQEYDAHGRPIPSSPPPAAPGAVPSQDDVAAPTGDPLAGDPAPAPSPGGAAEAPAESTETKPHGDPLAAEAAHAPHPPADAPPAHPSGQDVPEDRNKADYTPPSLTSGDPLAG